MKKFFLIPAALFILAACQPVLPPDPEAVIDGEFAVPFYGGITSFSIDANYGWKVVENIDELGIVPSEGPSGKTDITVTVPGNKGQEEADYVVKILVGDEFNGIEQVLHFTAPKPSLTYEGETYKVAYMQDGRYWMADNLRYVPNGKQVSDDLSAIDNGVWYPVNCDTKAFAKDDATIKAQGYLYTAASALGVSEITKDNFKTFEGAKGICPDGWHIPTGAEIFKLAGRVNGWPGSPTAQSEDKSSPSPYYDGTKDVLGNCKIELLNADGFNVKVFGTINVADITKTSGSILNTLSYILCSTGYKDSYDTNTGDFKNIQFYSLSPMNTNNGTCNGAYFNYRSGAAVRCILDEVLLAD